MWCSNSSSISSTSVCPSSGSVPSAGARDDDAAVRWEVVVRAVVAPERVVSCVAREMDRALCSERALIVSRSVDGSTVTVVACDREVSGPCSASGDACAPADPGCSADVPGATAWASGAEEAARKSAPLGRP